MSAFLAFRNAAVTVLRPKNARILPQHVSTNSRSVTLATRSYNANALKSAYRSPSASNTQLREGASELHESEQVQEHRPKPKEKKISQNPKNNDIPHYMVQVVDADGKLHQPQPLIPILDSVDLQTHVVRLVTHDPPIVRILTRLEDKMNQLKKKADKTTQGAQRVETMMIQLTWLTGGADYQNKLSKAKTELEKGATRVDIMFRNKPRVRYPSLGEMAQQMDEVAAAFEEVATEWKERSIERGTAYMFFQSKSGKKVRKTTVTREEIEAKAKEALELAKRQEQKRLQRESSMTSQDPRKLYR